MAVRCGVDRVGSLTIYDVERRGESSSRLCIAPWHSSSMQMVGLQPMAHGTVLLLNALRVYLVSSYTVSVVCLDVLMHKDQVLIRVNIA